MTALFSFTILLGATLLFLVQPMVGKIMLPRVGGSPAVWTTCMLFFQSTLLAGYAYAHLVGKLRRRGVQVGVHALTLLIPALTLPMAFPEGWTPDRAQSPALALLGALAVMSALPVVLVSTTGPLLQRWFSLSGAKGAGDPYFLFVASNAGSFIGLLAYPFVVEPALAVREQTTLWAWGYAAYAVLVVVCGVAMARHRAAEALVPAAVAAPPARPITWADRGRWMVCSAVPCSMLIGATQYLSTDVASVPLMWVLPLGLYLITFIVAFSPRVRLPLVWVGRVFTGLALLVGLSMLLLTFNVRLGLGLGAGLHASTMFFGALTLHGRLARERPDAAHLTQFYLILAVGGVVGGLFNSLLAPAIFSTVMEYPLALAGAILLCPRPPRPVDSTHTPAPSPWARRRAATLDVILPLALWFGSVWLFIATNDIIEGNPNAIPDGERILVVCGPALLAVVLMWRRPVRLALGLMALAATAGVSAWAAGVLIYETRTFFGVHRVFQFSRAEDSPRRSLIHGTTLHGMQAFDEQGLIDAPLSYYHPDGPLGRLVGTLQQSSDPRANRFGLVGLGVGSMAPYARPGDRYTYFEIDPAVVHIARDSGLFSMIRNTRGAIDIVPGDARLTLGSFPDNEFGLLLIDAFSSDAIPAHLLTTQAIELYLRKLRPEGILVLHISNRHLNLTPVVAAIAQKLDLPLYQWFQLHIPRPESRTRYPSQYLVLARSREALGILKSAGPWEAVTERSHLRPWTDDYSNILSILDP